MTSTVAQRFLRYVKDRARLLSIVLAFAVLPTTAGGFILWQMFSEQLEASYENRLVTTVETFKLLLDNKAKELNTALTRMASDNTLQVTMSLEILPQMRRYLSTHYELAEFELLMVTDASGAELASFGNYERLEEIKNLCSESVLSGVNTEYGFYLVRSLPVIQGETNLGSVCGAVDLRNPVFAMYLGDTLNAIPFIRWQGRTLVMGGYTKRLSAEEIPDIGVFRYGEGGREYKGMSSRFTLGKEQVDLGILIPMIEHEKGLGKLIRHMIALLSVIALVAFFALRFQYQRKLAKEELVIEKERALVTLASIGDAVFTTDGRGYMRYFNAAARQLLGNNSERAIGRLWNETLTLKEDGFDEKLVDPIAECLQKKEMIRAPRNAVLKRGNDNIPVHYSAAPLSIESNEHQGVVLVIRDVSQERQLQNRLAWRAKRDDLTGLLNRSEFRYRVEQALLDVKERDLEYALLYLDLDQFKVVNDSCGHHVGDQVLKQISTLLRSQLRATDTLFRLGGDEFGVLLKDCPPDQAYKIAEELCEIVKSYRISHRGNIFEIGVSIGLISLNADSGNPEEVISCVDSACYSAKDAGRNRVHVYKPSEGKRDRRLLEMAWIPRIRAALLEDRFCLYAQPIVEVKRASQSSISHQEILLRMVNETGELISPGAFIPVAERFGLMPEIDRWVVEKVLSSYSQYFSNVKRSGYNSVVFSINLSGASLADPGLGLFILEKLEKYRVPPHCICFEITETAAVTLIDNARQLIEQLKSAGCSFMLDDFGTGMSSFGYLKTLAVDYIKIDGLFVKDILDDPIDCAMVKSINEIGHILGLKTVAEYVESSSVLDRLSDIGIDYAQGFGIAEPRLLRMLPLANLHSSCDG